MVCTSAGTFRRVAAMAAHLAGMAGRSESPQVISRCLHLGDQSSFNPTSTELLTDPCEGVKKARSLTGSRVHQCE